MFERIKEIIEKEKLNKKCRKRNLIHRRAYLFNLMRKHGVYFREIGEMFNLHHSTVLHGDKMAELHAKNNDQLYLLDTLDLQQEFGNIEIKIEKRNLIQDIYTCKTMNELSIIQARLNKNQYA